MIALFGSNGYLGRELAYYFKAQGVHVDGFDVQAQNMSDVAVYEPFDVTSQTDWERIDLARYSAVLYFAGLTGTEAGFADPLKYLAVNEGGLLNLLSRLAACPENLRPKIIFPSTRLVYRGADCPLAEDAVKETRTPYAVNKLACEGYLEAYHIRFGIKYVVVRICVPWGSQMPEADYSYGTLRFFKSKIDAGEQVPLYGGGTQKRTFTHVADICRAVDLLAQKSEVGIFNIGGETLSLQEAVERLGGTVANVPWPEGALKIESGSTVFNSSRIDSAVSLSGYRNLAILQRCCNCAMASNS